MSRVSTTPLFSFEFRLDGGDWEPSGSPVTWPEDKAVEQLAKLTAADETVEYRLVPAAGEANEGSTHDAAWKPWGGHDRYCAYVGGIGKCSCSDAADSRELVEGGDES